MARRLVVDWCGVCGGINATCNVTVHHLHPQTTNSRKSVVVVVVVVLLHT